MTRARQLARAGARRRLLRGLINLAGPALFIAAIMAFTGVLIDRLVGPGLAWWHWVLWPACAGAIVSMVITILRRGSPLDAAIEIDHALKLDDRLGSALELEAKSAGDPFIAIALEDAERAADSANLKRAIPIRFGRSWIAWPVALALTGLLGWAVGPLNLLGTRAAQARPQDNPLVQSAAEDIDEIAGLLDEQAQENAPSANDDEASDLGPSPRELLDKLSDQLLQGEKSPDEARAEAAGVLNEQAEQHDAEAEQAQREQDALSEALRGIESSGQGDASAEADQTTVDKLREHMQSGNMQSAAQELADLEDRLKEMSPEERERLAQDMERLAQELDDIADMERKQAEARRRAQEQRLREQGLSEDVARQMPDTTDPEQIQQELQDQGIDEDQARRMAERIAEDNAERQAQEEAADEAEKLSDLTEQAAEDVAPETEDQAQETDQEQDQPQEGEQGQSDQQQTSEDQQGEPGESEDQTSSQPTDDPNADAQPSESGQPTDQEGSEPSPDGAEPDPTQPPTEISPDQQSPEQSQQQDAEQAPQQDPSGVESPEGTPDSSQQDGDQQQSTDEGEGEQPPQGEGDSDQPPQEGSGDQPPESGADQPQSGAGDQPPDGEQLSDGGGNQPPQGEDEEQPQGAGDQPPDDQPQPSDGGGSQPPQGDDQQQPQGSGEQPPEDQPAQPPQQGSGAGEQSPENPGEIPEPTPEGVKALRKYLEEMQRQEKDSQELRERAQDMRRQAREMLEKMSPEERERLNRWAEALQQENDDDNEIGPGAGDNDALDPLRPDTSTDFTGTDSVDARPDQTSPLSGDERVVHERLNPDAQPPERGEVSNREMVEELRRAQQESEEALEERQIPTRYGKVLEEYFRKARERAEEAEDAEDAEQEEPPAPAAEDVDQDGND